MGILGRLADNKSPDSLANRYRRRRFQLFERLISDMGRPLRVLDVGGKENFWSQMRFDEPDVQITLLNLHRAETHSTQITSVQGDATTMPEFEDGEFDVVLSNSVIEHLGTWDRQVLMAKEIQRVGGRYFVQTPNRRFPIEPHFYVPWFQYLPIATRASLARRFPLGYHERANSRDEALEMVREIRLLTASELMALFPGGALYRERVGGLTKSLVAHSPIPGSGAGRTA
jgi:SAM-dependent methyltransferase